MGYLKLFVIGGTAFFVAKDYALKMASSDDNQKSSLGQMTNNVNQTDLLCFKGKIKNKLFNLNLTGKENIDYNLNIIISINI